MPSQVPAVEVQELGGRFRLSLRLDDGTDGVVVSVGDDVVVFTGETTVEQQSDRHGVRQVGRSYRRFERCLQMPGRIDRDTVRAAVGARSVDVELAILG